MFIQHFNYGAVKELTDYNVLSDFAKVSMRLDSVFILVSYLAVLCGFVSLAISGTLGFPSSLLFLGSMVVALKLEGGRWQIKERPGTALIVLSIPFYFAVWKWGLFEFGSAYVALPGLLARLILTLSAIKLLQNKSDRDWVFLYLMAFFQVLLAAGLSISPLYLAVFVIFVFAMVCSVMLLEMRRTHRRLFRGSGGSGVIPGDHSSNRKYGLSRVLVSAVVILFLITLLAAPMFFLLPRVGASSGGVGLSGVATRSGFSDSVRLGQIGRIQESDEVVMRVKMDGPQMEPTSIRWRGIALDTFDNQTWSKSNNGLETLIKGDRDRIQVDYSSGKDAWAFQTFYVEPLDSPVLFGLPRPVAIEGGFPLIYRDRFKSYSLQRPFERSTYRVISDFSVPSDERLRADRTGHSADDARYLELPEDIDPRIAKLATDVAKGKNNRYDAARAIESYLQNNYGYTLEPKSGGPQPLSDFLFNVKEGHCEYFSTALAIMLRTQGIATRVVNGFQRGEYNETADIYVVRQKNAHSWVEVYFPGERAWVTFDATPFAGRESTAGAVGISNRMSKYLQAMEAFWIEYFVAFDNDGQRSLYADVKRGYTGLQRKIVADYESSRIRLLGWWRQLRGDRGSKESIIAFAKAAGLLTGLLGAILAFVRLYGIVVKSRFWLRILGRLSVRPRASIIEFFEKMQSVLEGKGFKRERHQTPLEFAYAVGIPEAIRITEKYNDVRFGDRELSHTESAEILNWLDNIARRNRC